MIITPQALRGIYTAFNTVFNKAFEGQHPTYEKVARQRAAATTSPQGRSCAR